MFIYWYLLTKKIGIDLRNTSLILFYAFFFFSILDEINILIMDKNLFNYNYLLFYFYHEFVILLSLFTKKKKQFETLFKIKEVCYQINQLWNWKKRNKISISKFITKNKNEKMKKE